VKPSNTAIVMASKRRILTERILQSKLQRHTLGNSVGTNGLQRVGRWKLKACLSGQRKFVCTRDDHHIPSFIPLILSGRRWPPVTIHTTGSSGRLHTQSPEQSPPECKGPFYRMRSSKS
jgi:hypothetical protein